MLKDYVMKKNIPHHLIEAFQSTLESAAKADLVLIVCDATGDYETQIKTTEDTLSDIHCEAEKILVMNKCDKVADFSPFPKNAVFISALDGRGIDELLLKINEYFKNTFLSKKVIFTARYSIHCFAVLHYVNAERRVIGSMLQVVSEFFRSFTDSGNNLVAVLRRQIF